MDKHVEIISIVGQHRQWPAEKNVRIMEEPLVPDGAAIAAVADSNRNDVCRPLLYTLGLDMCGPVSFAALRSMGSPVLPSFLFGLRNLPNRHVAFDRFRCSLAEPSSSLRTR